MKIRIIKKIFYNSISKEEYCKYIIQKRLFWFGPWVKYDWYYGEFYDEKSATSYYNFLLRGGEREEVFKTGRTK